jgi:hypothetical protein
VNQVNIRLAGRGTLDGDRISPADIQITLCRQKRTASELQESRKKVRDAAQLPVHAEAPG